MNHRETGNNVLVIPSLFYLLKPMKWSQYNELIDGNGCIYLFNPLRGKHLVLNPQLKDFIIKGICDVGFIAESHPQLYKCLKTEKFIVPQDCDEVEECIRMLNLRFSSKANLRITINPTLDCNLRCWYCYESHIKGSSMQSDVIRNVVKFVENQVQCAELQTLHLSFFGGEPLLKYKKVVKPIVEKSRDICVEYGKHFALSVTTNGVCLTPNVTDELLNMGILFGVQVAFDGGRKMHDEVKRFSDGRGCYDLVKKHLTYAIERGVATTVRCNYTQSNLMSFLDLLEDFRMYWSNSNLRFSFHKVWQEPETEELCQMRNSFKRKIADFGIHTNIDSYYGDSLNPCYADFAHNVVINYNGDVFRCTARDFDKEHRLGRLDDSGRIAPSDVETNGISSRLTQECPDCRMLPICTICFQQRSESPDGLCPNAQMRENARENVKRYFYDVINRKSV